MEDVGAQVEIDEDGRREKKQTSTTMLKRLQ